MRVSFLPYQDPKLWKAISHAVAEATEGAMVNSGFWLAKPEKQSSPLLDGVPDSLRQRCISRESVAMALSSEADRQAFHAPRGPEGAVPPLAAELRDRGVEDLVANPARGVGPLPGSVFMRRLEDEIERELSLVPCMPRPPRNEARPHPLESISHVDGRSALTLAERLVRALGSFAVDAGALISQPVDTAEMSIGDEESPADDPDDHGDATVAEHPGGPVYKIALAKQLGRWSANATGPRSKPKSPEHRGNAFRQIVRNEFRDIADELDSQSSKASWPPVETAIEALDRDPTRRKPRGGRPRTPRIQTGFSANYIARTLVPTERERRACLEFLRGWTSYRDLAALIAGCGPDDEVLLGFIDRVVESGRLQARWLMRWDEHYVHVHRQLFERFARPLPKFKGDPVKDRPLFKSHGKNYTFTEDSIQEALDTLDLLEAYSKPSMSLDEARTASSPMWEPVLGTGGGRTAASLDQESPETVVDPHGPAEAGALFDTVASDGPSRDDTGPSDDTSGADSSAAESLAGEQPEPPGNSSTTDLGDDLEPVIGLLDDVPWPVQVGVLLEITRASGDVVAEGSTYDFLEERHVFKALRPYGLPSSPEPDIAAVTNRLLARALYQRVATSEQEIALFQVQVAKAFSQFIAGSRERRAWIGLLAGDAGANPKDTNP